MSSGEGAHFRSSFTNQSKTRNIIESKNTETKSGRKSQQATSKSYNSSSQDRLKNSRKSWSVSKNNSSDIKKKMQQHKFDTTFSSSMNWMRYEKNQS